MQSPSKSSKSPSSSSSSHLKGKRGGTVVKWIESLRVPGGRYGNNVPLIANLNHVLIGSMAASECVLLCNVKPPQYLWYMVSGGICDVVQFLMDAILHYGIGIHNSSTCWAVSFTSSIVVRHSSHRYLVFGNYVGGYWYSLLRMYCGYSISIILSTVFHLFLVTGRRTNATPRVSNHSIAFVCTLLWTGIVNFFILKKLWTFAGGVATSKLSTKSKSTTTTPPRSITATVVLGGDVELATAWKEEDRLKR